jgi:hypothetical protein
LFHHVLVVLIGSDGHGRWSGRALGKCSPRTEGAARDAEADRDNLAKENAHLKFSWLMPFLRFDKAIY